MFDARAQVFALRSYGVETSLEGASLYRRRFFETYPGLKRWHDGERRDWLRGHAETRTLTGAPSADDLVLKTEVTEYALQLTKAAQE